jgi:hypothetical protein
MRLAEPASLPCDNGWADSSGKRSQGGDGLQEPELQLAAEGNINEGDVARGGASGGLRILDGSGTIMRLRKDVPTRERMLVGP